MISFSLAKRICDILKVPAGLLIIIIIKYFVYYIFYVRRYFRYVNSKLI